MNCRKCGNQILENEKFCRVCGEPVVNQTTVPPVQPQPMNNVVTPVQTQMEQPVQTQSVQPIQTQAINNNAVANKKSSSRSFTILFLISCIVVWGLNVGLQAADVYTSESVVATYMMSSSIILGICFVISLISNALINGSKVQINVETQDDQLIVSYIGNIEQKNNALVYEKVKSKKINFNLFSILVGPIYYIYRKMYIEALIIAIAEIAISFIPESGFLILILGFVFYPLYRRHINKEIEIIKSTSSDFESQKKLCSEKGGTNNKLCAIVFIVYILGLNLLIVSNFMDKTYDLENSSFRYSSEWKLKEMNELKDLCIDNKVLKSDQKIICVNMDKTKSSKIEFTGTEQQLVDYLFGTSESSEWNLIQNFTAKNDYYVAKFGYQDSSTGYMRIYIIIKAEDSKSNMVIITAYNKDSNDFESIEKVIDTIKFK